MNLSPMEIGLILVVAFLLFGPKRLPDLARSIGEGIREFRKSLAAPLDEAPKNTEEPPAQTEDQFSKKIRP